MSVSGMVEAAVGASFNGDYAVFDHEGVKTVLRAALRYSTEHGPSELAVAAGNRHPPPGSHRREETEAECVWRAMAEALLIELG